MIRELQNRSKSKIKCLFISFLAVIVLSLYSCVMLQAKNTADKIQVSNEWHPPEKVSSPVNSSEWEDGPSISPDGTVLYFSRGRDRDVGAYFSRKTTEGWTQPMPLDINVKSFPTGAPHTQDGKTLYFSSIRPGVFGLGDIYVSTYKNGKWDKGVNLGQPINTEQMDSEPFISPDNKTLYFASTRKGGKGKADIWMAKKKGNQWGKPVNLGNPVNSEFEETQPFVTQDGEELYFTGINRKGIPGPAIFRSLRQGEKWGEPEVVISGLVGEPTLTADKQQLYFVHIIREGSNLIDADIWFTRRRYNK